MHRTYAAANTSDHVERAARRHSALHQVIEIAAVASRGYKEGPVLIDGTGVEDRKDVRRLDPGELLRFDMLILPRLPLVELDRHVRPEDSIAREEQHSVRAAIDLVLNVV